MVAQNQTLEHMLEDPKGPGKIQGLQSLVYRSNFTFSLTFFANPYPKRINFILTGNSSIENLEYF